ncbi:hypothetical protein NSTC745_04415 [Nostoc sp. DSM 114161]|jgi:hypothetical protein|uniref:hypothetical protein n=1 Tax=Nostoc sp. DSM 114161 TaxID=3440143 RepID=UPI00404582DD
MEIRRNTDFLKFLRQSPTKIRILCSALVAVLYPAVFESLNRRIQIAVLVISQWSLVISIIEYDKMSIANND